MRKNGKLIIVTVLAVCSLVVTKNITVRNSASVSSDQAKYKSGVSVLSGEETEYKSGGAADKNHESFGNKIVEQARAQIGVVVLYDIGYYSGGFPPDDSGACADVVERSIRQAGYLWKDFIDFDMKTNPQDYSSDYDENINYRRVRNVKVFLDKYAEKIPIDQDYLPGDIVTYDQIPGSLWHIAVVSDKISRNGTPFLIHNYGKGVREDDFLNSWPAPKTGHYRLTSVIMESLSTL